MGRCWGVAGWGFESYREREREKPPGPALPTLRHLGLLCNVCRYMCGRNVVEAVSALSLLTFFSLKWLAKSFKDQFGTSQCGWVAGCSMSAASLCALLVLSSASPHHHPPPLKSSLPLLALSVSFWSSPSAVLVVVYPERLPEMPPPDWYACRGHTQIYFAVM